MSTLYKVVARADGHKKEYVFTFFDSADRAFCRLQNWFDWVILNECDTVTGSNRTLRATDDVMLGKDPALPLPVRKGRDIDHTGFCLGTFNTVTCNDCPSKNECIIMMMKDKTKELLKQMREDNS